MLLSCFFVIKHSFVYQHHINKHICTQNRNQESLMDVFIFKQLIQAPGTYYILVYILHMVFKQCTISKHQQNGHQCAGDNFQCVSWKEIPVFLSFYPRLLLSVQSTLAIEAEGRTLISKLDHHWFSWWLVAWSAPSQYLNQYWPIVNWTLGNKWWNLNLNKPRKGI